MLGLPPHPGVPGTVLLAVGVLSGSLLGVWLWQRLRVSLADPLVGLLIVGCIASTAAAAPFISWRVFEDLRYTSRIEHAAAERIGADASDVDAEALASVARAIPARGAYYFDTGPGVGAERRLDALAWVTSALLPRIRVTELDDADWILSWGKDPRRLGVQLQVVRVERPSDGPRPRLYYLGRVTR